MNTHLQNFVHALFIITSLFFLFAAYNDARVARTEAEQARRSVQELVGTVNSPQFKAEVGKMVINAIQQARPAE